jgi:threonine aldolase
VYVSLYKGLGGLGGSVLAGAEDIVAEARVWRRRHGGEVASLFPFEASAQRGLDELIPLMPRFLEHARVLAGALSEVSGIAVVPDPPQTPLFHLHLRGDVQTLQQRALDVAEERRVWLFHHLASSVVPNVSMLELNIGEPALEISPDEAVELFDLVVSG